MLSYMSLLWTVDTCSELVLPRHTSFISAANVIVVKTFTDKAVPCRIGRQRQDGPQLLESRSLPATGRRRLPFLAALQMVGNDPVPCAEIILFDCFDAG